MNNNMYPYFFSNPNNQNLPNMNLPNNPYFPNTNTDNEIRNLENRVFNLEKEVKKLQNKISRLENTPMPIKDNYTSNYQPNSYNMM